MLGTSGEAARQRYGAPADEPSREGIVLAAVTGSSLPWIAQPAFA
jgi:hypothetical protein